MIRFFQVVLLLMIVQLNAQSTASKQVSKFSIAAAELDTTKTIWMYLPVDYDSSSVSYPVIYMFDAQNLFDAETSYVGEWGVDEYLDQSNTKVIIVGIEHGNERRLEELTPFESLKHGGGKADDMLSFITSTLKPHIDNNYRTLSQATNTTIMGSSLGGLTAFYATLKYPETFGTAAAFSPSFWINPELFDIVRAIDINKDSRFYFTAGTLEGDTMVPYLEKMLKLLKSKQIPESHIKSTIVEGAEHNESFWASQFPLFIEWAHSNHAMNRP